LPGRSNPGQGSTSTDNPPDLGERPWLRRRSSCDEAADAGAGVDLRGSGDRQVGVSVWFERLFAYTGVWRLIMTESSTRIIVGDEASRAQFVDESQIPVTLSTPTTEPAQPALPAPQTESPATSG
jgi:hypothetical protein